MGFVLFKVYLTFWVGFIFVQGIKFSAESFSEISLLAREGKFHLESLTEKANVPQYGSCWKNAISRLQVGCKFLSENIQRDLALKFTDCFLQMSGHDPLNCDFPKSVCLQKLSDRAFNAYTEFYTHTQSICYFLQSQVWHEEAEKTIDKLASTSELVSQKLVEAERTQEKLLKHQKESLFLQHDLINNSKNVVSTLQISQEKINNIMNDFQNSASKQQELLVEVLQNVLSLKSWAVNEISWFSSTLFFIAATVIGFLFSSIPRTRGARIFIFIIFSLNYLFERSLISNSISETSTKDVTVTNDAINSWIWWCRKFCVSLSLIITLYTAFNYCDYNILNYQLLLEIRNQNFLILNHFKSQGESLDSSQLFKSRFAFNSEVSKNQRSCDRSVTSVDKINQSNVCNNSSFSPNLKNMSLYYPPDTVDHVDNDSRVIVSVTSEKSKDLKEVKSSYNLRSSKVFKD